MSLERKADRAMARMQWQRLYRFLTRDLGQAVHLIEPVAGLPDMVFTANAGLARNGKFVSSNFRNSERAGESPHFEEWFRERGCLVYNLPSHYYFEGEGDVLFADDENAYAGYLIRSDVNAHAKVADILGVRIVSLELVDPRFYHLDTCFCPLTSESAVCYPEAFDQYALEVIRANFPDTIEVAREEAEQFVCNSLVIGKHYVQPRGGRKKLRAALESRGYAVHEFDMTEFMKAGGAVKCLVLQIKDTGPGYPLYSGV